MMISVYTYRFRCLTVSLCCLLITVAAAPLLLAGEEDVLLSAMRDELKRSIEQLALEEMEKPYFIEYAVQDSERYRIEAVFGALTQSDHRSNRSFRVDVRVGNYEVDNSEFVSQRSMFSMFRNMNRGLVLENDYAALRRDLWLATDAAYKNSLEELAQKQSFMKTHLQTEEVSDFSREEPQQRIEERAVLTFDQAKWEGAVRRLSAIFREFPVIHRSEVSLRVELTHKYLLNSEGAECRIPEVIVSLVAHAATQVEDGNRLKHHLPFFSGSLEALPEEAILAADIRTMAEELTELATAPVLDEYYGPVMFTGPASGELFAQLFAAQLSGARPPLFEDQRMGAMAGRNPLASKLNRRVLPSFFTVTDDPTLEHEGEVPLIGGYALDDQGVPAQKLTVVEKGVLKNLLMSRRPSEDFTSSNGHGRAVGTMAPGPQVSNLIIRVGESLPAEVLKQELLDLCRDQGLSHGLIIRHLDNPGITGQDDSMSSMMSMMMGGGGGSMLTKPTLAYRVSVEDGSEELVRGVVLGELSISTLKDIIAAGSEYTVVNRLAASGGGSLGTIFSFMGPMGGMGNHGIPTSVVAPAVLLEEVELLEQGDTTSKPTLLQHPYFAE